MTDNGFIRPVAARGVTAVFRFSEVIFVHSLIVFFVLLVAAPGAPSAAALSAPAGVDDRDGNGREDLLDAWLGGRLAWEALREAASPAALEARSGGDGWPVSVGKPVPAAWERGNLRLLCLGVKGAEAEDARRAALDGGGVCRVRHEIARFGGVFLCEVDSSGLAAFLPKCRTGFVMLDRDGVPALDRGRLLIGAEEVWQGDRQLTGDWGVSAAILDSGCDTAHGDLGDYSQDNIDGPPPEVGHSLDWFPAEQGWTPFGSYKVIGWQDVTVNFPEAAGPWDYHHHGTALAGVVAGSGTVDGRYCGVAPAGRLTIVKFYEFDGVWHQWAGDFLAACAWTLDNADVYRIRVALAAVNWEVDAGISVAVTELVDAGILTIVAAGNDGLSGSTLGYPALCPAVLTVGAVNDDGALAAWSGRAPIGVAKPDLVAPGGGLLSTSGRIMTADNEPDDSYSERYGTSLAAAHVAGAALLVLDAWRQAAISLPDPQAGGRTLGALLCAAAAPVMYAEDSTGTGLISLSRGTPPDSEVGWGLVQVPAAIDALLTPLLLGSSLSDTLGFVEQEMVVARRLALLPNTEFVVEVQPQAGLDVSLEVIDLEVLVDPSWGLGARVVDFGGPGQSESLRGLHRVSDVAVVAVRRVSGSGSFILNLSAVAGSGEFVFTRDLGGQASGWLNVGRFAGQADQTIVVVSGLDIDPFARRLHAIAPDGQSRPGWPITFFLSDSQASLTAPLVWDLDGVEGDEVVVASSFGRVYLSTGVGDLSAQDITGGEQYALTVPVGMTRASGEHLVVLIDETGSLYRMDSSGTVSGASPLGGSEPLAPAIGDLDGAAGEEIVVLFASGSLVVCDSEGGVLPGWPVDLTADAAGAQFRDPILVDWQNDGNLEIVVPIVLDDGSLVEFRILEPAGGASPYDGVAVPAPDGGMWVAVSPPAVGRDTDGGGNVLLTAVAGSGIEEERSWRFREISLGAKGSGGVRMIEGFEVSATIATSHFDFESACRVPPLVHDYWGGAVRVSELLLSLDWQEQISGVANRNGSTGGWYRSDPVPEALCAFTPVISSAGLAVNSAGLSGAVIATVPGRWARVMVQGRTIVSQVGGSSLAATVCWGVQRGDGRNSGTAAPTVPRPAPVSDVVSAGSILRLWPNPSSGGVRVDFGGSNFGATSLDVFDVRGRRVRHFEIGEVFGKQSVFWDTCDGRGRPVAAGSYFFVSGSGRASSSARVIVTR